MNFEANRLESFELWSVPFIDKHELALLGFYYYGPIDTVKCYFCGVEIGMWEQGDDVLTDHLRWSRSCSLMRRRDTDNVPIDEALLDETLPPAPTPDVPPNTVSEGPIDVHVYRHQQSRIESFKDWPKSIRQRPEQLSDAGFYYTGKGDKVRCFSCSVELKDWEENDDPWEWHEKCDYVQLIKGDNFVREMERKRNESVASTSQPREKSDDKDEEGSRLCKICYNAEYNTIFLPCGHVIACAKCASSVSACPACRQSFEKVKRIYFS